MEITEKFVLSINEASEYFGIGIKALRRMAEDNRSGAFFMMGSHHKVVRHLFEEYLDYVCKHRDEMEEEENEETDT